MDDNREDAIRLPATEFQRSAWADLLRGKVAVQDWHRSVWVRLQGELDRARLDAALQSVVDSQPALRAHFSDDGDEMVVTTARQVPSVSWVDLSELEERTWRAQLLEIARASDAPFALTEGPLWRVSGVALPGGEHRVYLTVHRVICDDRSLEAFLEQWGREYEGQDGARPTLSWEDVRPQGGGGKKGWKERFQGLSPLTLPLDHPRPPTRTLEVAEVRETMTPEAWTALSETAKRVGAPPSASVLALFAAYIGRVAGQDEFVLGVPRAPRKTGGLLGPWNGLVPARFQDPGDSNLELRCQAVWTEWQEVSGLSPFAWSDLAALLDPESDTGAVPLASVRFRVKHAAQLSFGGLDAECLREPAERAAAEVELQLWIEGDAATLVWQYNRALFSKHQARGRLKGFAAFLEAAARKPLEPLCEHAITSDSQSEALLHDFNQSETTFDWPLLLHEGFDDRAKENPDAVALSFQGEGVTYRELSERTNRVANALIRDGIRPGDLVGVCMERGIARFVAIYATLKCGAAYVPLDPDYPKERLRYMVEDAQARVVIVDRLGQSVLPASDARVFNLETGEAALSDEVSADAPAVECDPDALAYVIYTSGSTGRPKGVMNSHRGVANRLAWMQEAFPLAVGDRVLHKTPYSFDVSVWELFWPLLVGAEIVVAPPGVHRDPGALARVVEESRVAIMHFVPSMLQAFLDDGRGAALSGLRWVVCSGEALSPALRDAFFAATETTELHNLYGPTEAAVDVTHWKCRRDSERSDVPRNIIPIGRPIANTRIYILDGQRNVVPVGVQGELYISGVQVARGYLGREKLTRERFLDDPFCPEARMYRTGDLARWLPTGDIEYLGRIDQQVKLRGLRIELGEIEEAVRLHPGIRSAAVSVMEMQPGDRRLVAHFVPDGDDIPGLPALRAHCAERLPEYMLPQHVVVLDALPMTASGKLDRNALPPPKLSEADADYEAPRGSLEERVARVWGRFLGVEHVSVETPFFELGGTSLLAVKVAAELRRELGRDVSVVDLFRTPTVRGFASALSGGAHVSKTAISRETGGDVAIVGMACRVPGASSVREFWHNLREGVESISWFDDLVPGADHVPARGIIPARTFDAGFFQTNPKIAAAMDPQQRVLLELAWHALEDAALSPRNFPGRVGVFAGVYGTSYYVENVLTRPDVVDAIGAFQAMVANDKDYVATRIAHKLDLRGPAVSVHTACSTSLVAVAQAMHSLKAGECDAALAGGASVTSPQERGHDYTEGGMFSPDGHCRPFDADAQGTMFSDGAGLVVLRRLEDAQRDGDRIYAVIRGAALGNDGADKMSFTAPSVSGQVDVIRRALAMADATADSVSYVEAHGTATPLGDPIEVAALREVFQEDTDDKQFCGLGSVKSNVGHTTAAAGVVGLMKVALSLHHGEIPKTLHFNAPNPALDIENSPFYVCHERQPWPRGDVPRRAGVSSFGVGGTNAHVLCEEAPPPRTGARSRPRQLLVLSAKTEEALSQMTEQLTTQLLDDAQDGILADAAFSLARRTALPHRAYFVVGSREQAATVLKERPARLAGTRRVGQTKRELAFLFPGQGAQYVGMGRHLYEEEPLFRQLFDELEARASDSLGESLRELMWGEGENAGEALRQTRNTQPALFIVGYALAKLWESWGVRPDLLVGHSIGEFAAAALSGVMLAEDALDLVLCRGRLMQELPTGGMLSVRLSAREVEPLLPAGLALAASNGPSLCVVAGPSEPLEAFAGSLEERDVRTRKLATSHAFHSQMMDPVVAPFLEEVRRKDLRAPTVPIVSTVSGGWMTDAMAQDPKYWAEHLRVTVRYSEAIQTVWKAPSRVLLEVGPRTTCAVLARQHAEDARTQLAISSLADTAEEGAEWDALLAACGKLWAAGYDVDWDGFYGNRERRVVSLPLYPFASDEHWLEPGETRMRDEMDKDETKPPGAPSRRPRTSTMHLDDSLDVDLVEEYVDPEAGESAHAHAPALASQLIELIEETSGIEVDASCGDVPFVELGLDSLFLTQVALSIKKRFGVQIRFRQLMDELSTLDALSAFLAPQVEVQKAPAPVARVEDAPQVAPVVGSVQGGVSRQAVEQLIQQQMAVMQEQLRVLEAATRAPASLAGGTAPAAQAPQPKPKAFGAQARIDTERRAVWSGAQSTFVDQLFTRYIEKTQKSKAYTDQHRARMADPRVVSGFAPHLKEVTYALVVDRSAGSRVWDIDGNEYIDLTCGFGADYFGHSPPMVVEAVKAQLDRGIEIGPQHPLAGDVTDLMCRLTGSERVALCNTGSEAVLGALRIARTVTGREKIAVFDGSYHGIFNEVVVRGTRRGRSLPAAAGIPSAHVGEVMVLPYGEAESLRTIEKHADSLAAVLIEPVQGRRPDLVPKEFLHELRGITEREGCAYIFDEVITGFRIRQGGAQEYFGIRADLATYGKVIGGGMPIAAIGGKAQFMDALDGGTWQYGDDSGPTVGVTYFAGTFVRHPPALAAAKAALSHLEKEGPELQHRVNALAERFVDGLNETFQSLDVPISAVRFGSVLRLKFAPEVEHTALFYLALRLEGIHIQEGFPVYVTMAHTEEDIDRLLVMFRAATAALRREGLLPSQDEEEVTMNHLVPREGTVAMTPAQREMWALGRLDDDAALAFNESFGLELTGPVDIELLKAAVRQTVGRHPALRLRASQDGTEIAETDAPWDVAVHDLRSHGPDMARAALARLIEEDAETPIDLVRGPVCRSWICRLTDDAVYLSFTAHHAVCDGWSTSVVLADIGAYYRGQERAPVKGFLEYSADESGPTNAENRKASWAYWRKLYEQPPEPMDLPTDAARPAMRTYRSDRVDFALTPERLQSVDKVASSLGCSRFVVMLAAFAGYLSRLTGKRDLVVLVPSAGQALAGEPELVGYCVKPLPLRIQVSEDDTFKTLAKRVKDQVVDGFDHADLNLGEFLASLKLSRDGGRIPLIPVMFNLDPELDDGLDMGDVSASFVSHPRVCDTFEWFVNALEANGRIVLECQYNTALFDRETVRRRLGELDAFSARALADPQALLETHTLLTPEEVRCVVATFNETSRDYPTDGTLHGKLTEQAEKTPDAPALVSGDQVVTYRELDERSSKLARALADAGVAPGTRVGIAMGQSSDRVTAIYAAMKAGGAYVPLDPAYPEERLRVVSADAGCEVVLADEVGAEALGDDGKVWRVDSDWEGLTEGYDAGAPDCSVTPDDIAYVIYTSGSTGIPKGVPNTHRAVENHLQAMQEIFGLTSADRLVQHTAYSFDVSVWELFWPLHHGASLLLPPAGHRRDAQKTAELIEKNDVTVAVFVPSVLRAFLARGGGASMQGVRAVLCIGEVLPRDLCDEFFAQTERTELHNLYGPTEAAVAVTHWQCFRAEEGGGRRGAVPIGSPMGNVRMYVLDDTRRPTPIGVAGELYIGGVQVAPGYWERDALTEERFVRDPFCEAGKMYRTGDMAQWTADGVLEFFGRTDGQVKLRGLRIELGEIEAVLGELPSVASCAAVVLDGGGGDQKLVAHIVWQPGQEQTSTELRKELRKKLPDYMVPQLFAAIDALPMTNSGKLDRQALPVPEGMGRSGDEEFLPPTTEEGLYLADVWRQVLGVTAIASTDNFFDLGGHSLLAIDVVERVRREQGVDLEPRALLLETLDQIASRLTVLAEGTGASGQIVEEFPAEDLASIRPPLGTPQLGKRLARITTRFIKKTMGR